MKKLVLTLLACMVPVSAAHAQTAAHQKRSKAAIAKRAAAERAAKAAKLAEQQAAKAAEPLEPPMPARLPQLGDTGRLPNGFRVKQIVDEQTMLVGSRWNIDASQAAAQGTPGAKSNNHEIAFWLVSYPTKGIAVGAVVEPKTSFTISGTKQYGTVAGASKTIFVLEPVAETKPVEKK